MDAHADPAESVWRHLRRWGAGFLLATALMILIAPEFLDSVAPHRLAPELGRPVAPPGHRHRFRSEGWATTVYGPHGLSADVNLAAAGSRVALWGDSFVEAHQVGDPRKMAQQVSALWRERGHGRLTGVGIARGDRNVADYYHLLPRYEALAPFLCHVIVLPSLRDVCPDGRHFVAAPACSLADRRRPQPWPGLRALLTRWRLDALWRPFWSLVGERRSPLTARPLRLRPGPVPPAAPARRAYAEVLADCEPAAWSWLVAALRDRARSPVVFLLIPEVPRVRDGRILTTPLAREHSDRFAAVCAAAGVDFLDLTERFAAHWRRTGRLPRGFSNGVPGRGHLNAVGHGLVAAAVCDYLEAKYPHAVHPD